MSVQFIALDNSTIAKLAIAMQCLNSRPEVAVKQYKLLEDNLKAIDEGRTAPDAVAIQPNE